MSPVPGAKTARQASQRPAAAEVPTPPRQGRWPPLVAAALIIVVGLAAYANSFQGQFLFDDRTAILDKRDIWRQPLLDAVVNQGQTPVLALSLALNYQICGDRPWGYHLFNLTVHLLAALALFGLLRRTLLTEPLEGRFGSASIPLAAVVSLVWIVHPLQTESVTYIIQRKESLMGLFYLLTLYCALRGHGPARSRWWRAGAVVSCALGMWAKQVMATAPLMVLLYDRTFLSGSFKKALARSWSLYALLFANWGLLLTSLGRFQKEGAGLEDIGLGRAEYAQTQFGVILHYLRLAFWPDRLCLDYAWPVARTLAEIALPAGVIAVLVLGSLWLFWRRQALGFAGAWFFLILAPTSSVIVITELAFEHRMYLSLAAVAAVAVLGGYALGRRLLLRLTPGAWPARLARIAGIGAVAALVCGLVVLTHQRNEDYYSELGMWQGVVAMRPDNPRAHFNLGVSLAALDRNQEAVAEYSRTIQLRPQHAKAYHCRGLAREAMKLHEEAIEDHTEAIRLKPDYAEAFSGRGAAYHALGKFDQAIQDYGKAIDLKPDLALAYNDRGTTYDAMGRHDLALKDLTKAIQLKPDYAQAYTNRSKVWGGMGRFQDALADGNKAVELDPGLALAYCDRSIAYGMMGDYDRALQDATKAIQLKPDYGAAYFNRAVTYYRLKDYQKAWDDLATCKKLNYEVNPAVVEALVRDSGQLPGWRPSDDLSGGEPAFPGAGDQPHTNVSVR